MLCQFSVKERIFFNFGPQIKKINQLNFLFSFLGELGFYLCCGYRKKSPLTVSGELCEIFAGDYFGRGRALIVLLELIPPFTNTLAMR